MDLAGRAMDRTGNLSKLLVRPRYTYGDGLNYFVSKPVTWAAWLLKLLADGFLPNGPGWVFWLRPIAFTLLLTFSLCWNRGSHG
jgi:hypothetical protein